MTRHRNKDWLKSARVRMTQLARSQRLPNSWQTRAHMLPNPIHQRPHTRVRHTARYLGNLLHLFKQRAFFGHQLFQPPHRSLRGRLNLCLLFGLQLFS